MEYKTVVAIGDIFIDYIADVGSQKGHFALNKIRSSTNIFSPVNVSIGGSGLQFAVAAKKAGFEKVFLIGKAGGIRSAQDTIKPDIQAKSMISYLKMNKVHPLVSLAEGIDTGRIMLVYLPGNRRLMISDPLANATFTMADISDEMIKAVSKPCILHISGYWLLQENRKKVIIELAKCAHKAKCIVALDIVPHNIYQILKYKELCHYFKDSVDWIFVEAPTAHRLLGLGKLNHFNKSIATLMIKKMQENFPSITLYENPSRALVADKNELFVYKTKYDPGVGSRGQSATAQATLLYDRLHGAL
jgi:sugar/nucleoside kinase (ribokinase family)